jgi:hypothetical protein
MNPARVCRGALGCALLLLAESAGASANFPSVVQAELGLRKAPDCVLCHQTDKGGENTTTQLFGRTMQRFGTTKKNNGSLVDALRKADALGTDSDGDCVPDTDELRAGTNPNVVDGKDGGSKCAVETPPPTLETGCAIAAPRRENPSVATLVMVALSVLRRASREPAGEKRLRAGSAPR